MSDLSRIGVAIESDLLEEFDALIARRGYPSRSEAFRDLIRDALIQESAASDNARVVGTVTLVYAHRVRLLREKLTSLQHTFHHAILSTLHVHLDHDNCLEVVVVRGKAGQVRRIADALISMKGVKHGRLTVTTAGPSHEGK
jgi:CopG family nickel-responsive transcriptional regulator